jgi:hypothetical protein
MPDAPDNTLPDVAPVSTVDELRELQRAAAVPAPLPRPPQPPKDSLLMDLKNIDLNNNGVPDYRDPAIWRAAWRIISWAVRTFAPANTVAYRAVQHGEQLAAEIRAALPPAP